MEGNWRYNTKRVSKYNPQKRDKGGRYLEGDWVAFFQIGEFFAGKKLSIEKYLETETLYINAAILFFKHHNCSEIVLRNIEKNNFESYTYADKIQIGEIYNTVHEGMVISLSNLNGIVKLILREIIWGELFCSNSAQVAVRFGYDYYIYFNSPIDIQKLLVKIEDLGLFVD